jgi:hypothetical protein
VDTYKSPDLQTAVFDLHRYLLDQIPPLTASDAVETLISAPPELVMKQIQGWAVEQARYQSATQSDLFFHAIRKMKLVSVLKLVDRIKMENFLERLYPLAIESCPAEERETLQKSLASMHDSVTIDGGTVVDVARAKVAKPGARGSLTDAVSRSAHRLSMVVERLARHIPLPTGTAPGVTPVPQQAEPAAQLVTMAAESASTEDELKTYLRRLGKYTGEQDPAKLFHVLASAVPQWDIPVPDTAGRPAAIEAMRKIIALTSDLHESGRRFRELVTEAIDQFNQGGLGAAVSMLDLAAKVVHEKRIDPSVVERIHESAVDSISSEQLRKYSDNKAKHVLLRRALSHFPTLRKESLFDQLRGEERPERRRAILGLLEAYGSEAREQSLVELDEELRRPAGEMDTYYLRNVIYLLHRIPRDSDEGVEAELELLSRATARGQNIYVIKEAVTPLGHIRTEAAAKILTMRLAEFEAMLVRKDISLYPMEEMQKVIDRITAALGRVATPAALLTIARHGMKPNPLLGDTRSRLTVLSQHDLSFDERTVDILINAIREDLPPRILGRVLPARQPPPLRLIEALSSTRSEKVEILLSEIAEKYGDHELGRAANAALAKLAEAGAATTVKQSGATLTGDLEFFGLPSLLQSLADQQATGIITLTSRSSGQTAGKLLLVDGKFADAQAAHLRGVEALYQLLERPVTGHFAFVPHATPPQISGEPLDIMPLLFEGIRRHDELRQMMIFVPDDLTLHATKVKPTPDAEERDPVVIREVWVKASSGTAVAEWEPLIAVDTYRTRRLVGRWLEEGALQPVV